MPGLLDRDIFDLDPLKLITTARPRQEWRRPASPEETESFGQWAAQNALTGLGAVLHTIDTPRRLLAHGVNKVIGGAPLSDEASGQEINQRLFGLNNDNSWKSWGAGLATEIVTDPLTYMTFGAKHALTGAGKVAKAQGLTRNFTRSQMLKGFDYAEDTLKAAGHTPEAIEHLRRTGKTIAPSGSGIQASQPLAGIARLGVPGTKIGVTAGTGRAGQAVAKVLDTVGDVIKYSSPIRMLAPLFDSSVGRAVDAVTQKGMRQYGTPMREEMARQGAREVYRTNQQIRNLMGQGVPEEEIVQGARMAAENVSPSAVLPGSVNPDIRTIGQERQARSASRFAEGQKAGLPKGALEDPYIQYGEARQGRAYAPTGPQMRGGNLFPTTGGSDIRRKKWAVGVPGGTEMINKWSLDPNLAGAARAYDPKQAQASIFQDMVAQAHADGHALTPEVLGELEKKAAQLARRLRRHDPTSGPIFNRNIVGDVETGEARHARGMASAKAFYGTVGDVARRMQAGDVPVTDLLRTIGRDRKFQGMRLKTFIDPNRIEGGLVELHKVLAKAGMGPTEPFVQQLLAPIQAAADPKAQAKAIKKAMAALKGEVSRYGVTPEHAEQILHGYARWAAPEELVRPLKGFDSFTNLFRNMAYSIWLPSHVRNLMGGLVQSATQTGPGLRDYVQMARLMGDNSPAAQALKGEMYANAKIFRDFNAAETLAAKGPGTPRLPGSQGFITPREMGKAAWETARGVANPVNWPGAFSPLGVLEQVGVGRGERNFPWLEAGRRLGSNVEDFLRGSQYLGAKRAGFTPAEAGREVLRTHFDYGGLTPFERKVMRRVVPFYTFASRNLPLQLDTLVHRPGVVAPQLRLAAGRPGEFVPSYLAPGVAIPTGPEENGQQQFISQLGIPVEEAFERFKVQPGDPMGTARNVALAYMAGMNPLLKAPLEQLFNTQFYTGRKLSDLRPQGTVGTISSWLDPDQQHRGLEQFAAQALANTPATRFLTMADKLADPRKQAWAKALNLLTGVRVSDVDMEKSRAIEMRKMLEGLLQGSPAVSWHHEPYIRPEDQARLTPEEIARLQVFSRLQSNAQLAARKRRQEQAAL